MIVISMKEKKAPISEIFCSWQGEGLFAGEKQIFVRFSGCNMRCTYCDEPASREKGKELSISDVISIIRKLSFKYKTKAISFTGGEPLLYCDFIKEICLKLLKKKFIFRLETNGTLPENLKKVIKHIHHISADIKFPSQTGVDMWKIHERFISMCGKKACVKVVVSLNTPISEFKKAARLVKKILPETNFFIQPESGEFLKKRNFSAYDKFYREAYHLKGARLLPQLHKIWNIK